MCRIVDVVNSFLENYDLKNLDYPLCLGFSGGYDSMCLLHILHRLGVDVVAAHLNHNWRGDESLRDYENCKRFCEENNIKFYSEVLPDTVPKNETSARNARYDFFDRCLKKYNSKVFFTAHNADDNAETVLYRIVKGTGVDGLAAILPKRGVYYRPLLNVRRSEIEAYCKSQKLLPNVDSSNSNVKYKRNLIRHKVLPLLAEINPDVVEAINSLSNLAFEDSKLLECDITHVTADFVVLPRPIQGRIIKNMLLAHNLDYSRDRIELIIDFIFENKLSKSGKIFSIGKNSWVFVCEKYFDIVNIQKKNFDEVKITSEGEYDFLGGKLIVEKCNVLPDKFPKDSENIAYAFFDSINFTLRTRREGDVISPLGTGGSQKLKKFLNGKKIPTYVKDTIPMLCSGKEVLWVVGVGISEKIKVVDSKISHVIKFVKKGGKYEG